MGNKGRINDLKTSGTHTRILSANAVACMSVQYTKPLLWHACFDRSIRLRASGHRHWRAAHRWQGTVLTAGDRLKGEISSSSSPLAAAFGAALALLATVLLVLAFSAATGALLSGLDGDVAAVDSLLDGLLFAPLWPPLLGCADLSSSKPAGQCVATCLMQVGFESNMQHHYMTCSRLL